MTTATQTDLVPVARIVILWSESDYYQESHNGRAMVYQSIEAVNQELWRMAEHAPQDGDGYHKTAYRITWEDGEMFESRIDLHRTGERQETSTGKLCLLRHMRDHFVFNSGLACPTHMTPTLYRTILSRQRVGYQEYCRRMLDTHTM